jgi:sugar phosphate isomerase/epimerase
MLLTLTANALRSRISSKKGGRDAEKLHVTDLPKFARQELNLYGLNLSTNLLVGADLSRLDAIREAADKASCPCLVLNESEVQPFASLDDDIGDAAVARVMKVVQAANRLGCNSIGVSINGEDSEEGIDFAIERLRKVMGAAERLEVNILLLSTAGFTADPERLTDLIKKVGGFRIGTFPDFETASKAADPLGYLRRLTPYAAAVTASMVQMKAGKKAGHSVHGTYDVGEYVRVIQAVGYTGTLALDYRGDGDPVEHLKQGVELLQSLVGPTAEATETELLDDDASEGDQPEEADE